MKTSWIGKGITRLAFVAALGVTVLGGCIKTGSVVEQQPLAQKVPHSGTVAVVVKTSNAEWQADADQLKEGLLNTLAEKGGKYAEGADFVFEVTLVAFDKGNKAERMFVGSGEAELHSNLELKAKDGKTIAKLGITGNSKRKSTMKIGGYNTAWGDSLPGRAVIATIEQITEYLEAHG